MRTFTLFYQTQKEEKKDGRITKSKSKLQKSHQEISFAVMWITTESQLRMRGTEGFCGGLFSPPTPQKEAV